MMPVRGYWLPPGVEPPPGRFATLGALTIETPEVTPALALSTVFGAASGRGAIAAMSTDAIIRALDAAVAAWIAPDSEPRRLAEEAYVEAAGVPRVTVPFVPLLEACASPHLKDWVRAEVSPVAALDGFVAGPDGAMVRALGPRLAVHVLPGNVPLVWLPTLLACLVMRTPCLLKPAREDPLTAALFAATVAAKSPELGAALAVLPWTGGDERVEAEVLRGAGALIAYGDDPAIVSLARRLPAGVPFVAHGPRIAVGVVAREAQNPGRFEAVAAAAARDALLYDGRGCLSLSAVFVERGGLMEPGEVVTSIAGAMPVAATALPAGRPDRDTAALTQSWRARIRARMQAGKPSRCAASPRGLDWTVLYDEELPMPAVPLYRTVWIAPFRDYADLTMKTTRTDLAVIHAIAFAGPDARRRELAEVKAGAGLTRLTDFGKLQTPPLAWPHGGASPFRRLLNWTRLESR
ncbi:MAG: acyl-CoA reductase [Candidatus Coatesbacteria bacterium]